MQQPSTSFSHAASKIVWANEHVAQFKHVSELWLKTKPYTTSVERDPDGPYNSFEIGLTNGLPEGFALLAGDICANLRASLDYAWMGLVRAANPGNPSKCTLPIGSNRKDLIRTIMKAPIGAAALPQAINLLADTLGTHRDFSSGGNEPLAALNDLSNWNKHNMLMFQTGTTTVDLTFGGDSGISVRGGRFVGDLFPFIGGLGNTDNDIKHKQEPVVELIFGDHALVVGKAVFPTLLSFSQVCTEALKAFCVAFPSPCNPTFT